MIIKTKTILKKGWFVDSQGFEPQMTEPKSVVLPLHHVSDSMQRNYRNYFKYENLNSSLVNIIGWWWLYLLISK